jgi:hypothetical protein
MACMIGSKIHIKMILFSNSSRAETFRSPHLSIRLQALFQLLLFLNVPANQPVIFLVFSSAAVFSQAKFTALDEPISYVCMNHKSLYAYPYYKTTSTVLANLLLY